jgi:hypothetical protein
LYPSNTMYTPLNRLHNALQPFEMSSPSSNENDEEAVFSKVGFHFQCCLYIACMVTLRHGIIERVKFF